MRLYGRMLAGLDDAVAFYRSATVRRSAGGLEPEARIEAPAS